MTTYTVINPSSGEPEGRHLSAEDAAAIILTHDGCDYEIRSAGERFELWTRQEVANVKWSRTVISSYAATSVAAEAEIYQTVVDAHWERHPEAMTDESYDLMLVEIASEQ